MSPKRALVVRAVVLGCALASTCAVVASASAGTAASAAAAPAPRAKLRAFDCQRALDPPVRAIALTAVMRPVAGTQRMELRFVLLRRLTHHRRFVSVHGGDLGRWISPRNRTLGQLPTDVWNLIKQVADLAAPAWYRFRVTFRWTGAGGQRLGELTRTSPTCYQPELRPDLLVRSITVRPIAGQPSEDSYTAAITNAGASGAGPFVVKFSDAGQSQDATVSRLAAHATVYERFAGPACTPSGAPTVSVDPNHRVADANRANNTMTATCRGA